MIYILLFISTIGALFETFVLTSLALFVTMLVDINLFLDNLYFEELKGYLFNLSKRLNLSSFLFYFGNSFN